MKKIVMILMALNCVCLFALAGGNPRNGGFERSKPMKPMFAENYFVPFGADSLRSSVLLRVPYSTLNFKRNTVSPEKGTFFAILNINVSYKNSEQIIKGRTLLVDTLYVNSSAGENLQTQFYSRSVTSMLAYDRYDILVEATDENKRQIATNSGMTIDMDKTGHLPELFAYSHGNGEYAAILDSSFDWRASEMNIYVTLGNSAKSSKITYSIEQIKSKHDEGFIYSTNAKQAGTATLLANSVPQFAFGIAENKIQYASNNDARTAKITLDKSCMMPGSYELTYKTDLGVKFTKRFDVEYVNQPNSLSKLELAVRSMEYLLDEKDFSDLCEADKDKQYGMIYDYFAQNKMPAAGVFPENMHEFFRRIDYGIINFVDPQNPDGSRTSRGRVYALWGSPAEIHSKLEADISKEIWRYNNPAQEITFEISKGGFYRITEIK